MGEGVMERLGLDRKTYQKYRRELADAGTWNGRTVLDMTVHYSTDQFLRVDLEFLDGTRRHLIVYTP